MNPSDLTPVRCADLAVAARLAAKQYFDGAGDIPDICRVIVAEFLSQREYTEVGRGGFLSEQMLTNELSKRTRAIIRKKTDGGTG